MQEKITFLSKDEVELERFRQRWLGLEARALEIIKHNECMSDPIEIRKADDLIAVFDAERKRVITYFPEGCLALSYGALELKLKKTEEESDEECVFNDKSLTLENGRRPGQRLSDDRKFNLYFDLADTVGTHKNDYLQNSEELALLQKRKKCCCVLY